MGEVQTERDMRLADLKTDEKAFFYDSFILVNNHNVEDVIKDFENNVINTFECNTSNVSNSAKNSTSLENEATRFMRFLLTTLLKQSTSVTIVQENYNIERSYRDSYYVYFSNMHFDIVRYSRRLSFFLGEFSEKDFYSSDNEVLNSILNNFVGNCVVNPTFRGAIGRTLLSPRFVMSDDSKPAYMRLSKYNIVLYGVDLVIEAFPYRMQDQAVMRCTEVTLLNLSDYHSNTFKDYKIMSPSEILELENQQSYERVLPSRGIPYSTFTKVLAGLGFSPRLYNLYSFEENITSSITRKQMLKRILYYYVESGIPVAVDLNPISGYGNGHSIICIGHGTRKNDALKKAVEDSILPYMKKGCAHPIVDSADFFDDYVVIDDNQFAYQVRPFDNLSIYPDLEVVNIAVPLYKRMFLDAMNAQTVVHTFLNHEHYGINAWASGYLNEDESVIIRLFMVSTRNFRKFRIKNATGIEIKNLYAHVPLPRFVWVCELYNQEGYDNKQAFGEIIIDATSAPNAQISSVISMRYPKTFTFRSPDTPERLFDMEHPISDELITAYRYNLHEIK